MNNIVKQASRNWTVDTELPNSHLALKEGIGWQFSSKRNKQHWVFLPDLLFFIWGQRKKES